MACVTRGADKTDHRAGTGQRDTPKGVCVPLSRHPSRLWQAGQTGHLSRCPALSRYSLSERFQTTAFRGAMSASGCTQTKRRASTRPPWHLNRGNTRGGRTLCRAVAADSCQPVPPVPDTLPLPHGTVPKALVRKSHEGSEEIEGAGELIDVVDTPMRDDGRKTGRRMCSQNDGKTVRPFRKLLGGRLADSGADHERCFQ
jgi:hypothetical protein